eukprot:5885453-Pyramimonas_sp.AAC.2
MRGCGIVEPGQNSPVLQGGRLPDMALGCNPQPLIVDFQGVGLRLQSCRAASRLQCSCSNADGMTNRAPWKRRAPRPGLRLCEQGSPNQRARVIYGPACCEGRRRSARSALGAPGAGQMCARAA